MRKRIHDHISWLCALSIAFFIPVYGRALPIIIIVMVFNWFFEGRYIKTIPLLFREKIRIATLSLSLIYILYLIGLFYTTNYSFGLLDGEIKLSMFIFPILFATSCDGLFTDRRISQILMAFIAGCISGSLILLVHSYYVWFNFHNTNPFYYTNLSWFFHSTYVSMYYDFAIVILLYKGFRPEEPAFSLRRAGYLLLVAYFILLVLLLSSKAGILILAFICIMMISFLLIRRQMKNALLLFLVISALFIIGFVSFSYTASRFITTSEVIATEQNQLGNRKESTAERRVIWKATIDIIKRNPMVGVGTGDIKDALLKQYETNHSFMAVEQNLNSHNQYLQTFATLGLPGILVLLAMIFIPAFRAFRSQQMIYLSFLLIFAINILFESMFEIQAGVIFFAFFNTLLFRAENQKGTISRAPLAN